MESAQKDTGGAVNANEAKVFKAHAAPRVTIVRWTWVICVRA